MSCDRPRETPTSGLGYGAEAAARPAGRIVLIVGPSGAGKDTLLRMAKAQFAGDASIVFAPRDVTRADGSAEERAVEATAFDATQAAGGYALWWRAHGLAYGVRAAIDGELAAGRTVVVNASRTVVTEARGRYRDVVVVLIDAPIEVRAARLAARRRAADVDLSARVARNPDTFATGDADVVIDNTGDPTEAAVLLARAIVGDVRS